MSLEGEEGQMSAFWNPTGSQADAARTAGIRGRFVGAVLLLSLLLFVSLSALVRERRVRREIARLQVTAHRLQQRADVLEDNALLTAQQLDRLFADVVVDAAQSSIPPSTELLEVWREYDHRYVDQNQDRPAFRIESLSAQQRLGVVYCELGDYEAGLEHFHHAVALLVELVDEDSSVVGYHEELAVTWHRIGLAELAQGDYGQADAAFAKSIGELEWVRQTQPLRPHVHSWLIAALENRVQIREGRGELLEAARLLQRILQMQAARMRRDPVELNLALSLAESHLALTELLARAGRKAEAEDAAASGVTAVRNLARRFPDNDRLPEVLNALRSPLVGRTPDAHGSPEPIGGSA